MKKQNETAKKQSGRKGKGTKKTLKSTVYTPDRKIVSGTYYGSVKTSGKQEVLFVRFSALTAKRGRFSSWGASGACWQCLRRPRDLRADQPS